MKKILLLGFAVALAGCEFAPACPEFDGFADYPVECVIAGTDPLLSKSSHDDVAAVRHRLDWLTERAGYEENAIMGAASHGIDQLDRRYDRPTGSLEMLDEMREMHLISGPMPLRELADISVELLSDRDPPARYD